MPLRPPSYKGQDVWFSPDVFVNKSEVALWQPPWAREEIPFPSIGPVVVGDDIMADGSVISQLQAKTYLDNLVKQGTITPEQATQIQTAKATENDATTNAIPADPGKAISNDTGGIENLKEFPLNLQLSRYFTLGQLTQKPWVQYAYDIPPQGINGLTAGQIVANLKLLAVNILDRIKDKYPNMKPTNTFRAKQKEGQHGLGQAADIMFWPTPFSQYYDIAIWVRDNLPFDQLILEYSVTAQHKSCWIHVSYKPNPRPYQDYKVGSMIAPSNWINFKGLTNYAPNLGMA